jgi:hypothetical protein
MGSRGDDDYNKFILEAIKAKDYIQKHIRGTMVKNRDRKANRGEFSGHAVPTGFLLQRCAKRMSLFITACFLQLAHSHSG